MRGWLLLLALLIVSGCQQAPATTPDPALFITPEGPYDFQWDDPLVATVVTTPPHQRAALPKQVPVQIRRITVPGTPPVPAALWYQHGMPYALAAQPGPAPLVFLIAGTGGNATSKTTTTLTRVLYASGYHVLAVPSPTHSDFMVNASSTGVPGRLEQDARDLYQAMKLAYDDVRGDIDITGTRLTGYSLGGWHAAFLAYLDADYGDFGFERVLLLNPPVSLYRSMTILDTMLIDNIEGGIDGVPAYADRVMSQLSRLYAESAHMGDLSGDFLYAAYLQLKPTDKALAALVGMVFRLIAVDTVMTADLVSRQGAIIDASNPPTWFTPLTPYWPPSVREGFTGYLDNLLLPYFRRQDPGLSRETLVHEATLERIEPFLAESEKIYMITNADDIILADGDLAWLTRVFGNRAKVFPSGGHCGNYEHPHVIAAINQALAPSHTFAPASAPAPSSGSAVTP